MQLHWASLGIFRGPNRNMDWVPPPPENESLYDLGRSWIIFNRQYTDMYLFCFQITFLAGAKNPCWLQDLTREDLDALGDNGVLHFHSSSISKLRERYVILSKKHPRKEIMPLRCFLGHVNDLPTNYSSCRDIFLCLRQMAGGSFWAEGKCYLPLSQFRAADQLLRTETADQLLKDLTELKQRRSRVRQPKAKSDLCSNGNHSLPYIFS